MTPSDTQDASNDYLAQYDEARRVLTTLRRRLEDIGNVMRNVASSIQHGHRVLGHTGHYNPQRSPDLQTACQAFAEFEGVLNDYRATHERATNLYQTLTDLGRESIKDLANFPDY